MPTFLHLKIPEEGVLFSKEEGFHSNEQSMLSMNLSKSEVPLILGIFPLFLVVYASLFTWWWLMSFLFSNGIVGGGVFVGYLLPPVISVVAWAESRRPTPRAPMTHLIVFGLFALAFLIFLLPNAGSPINIFVATPQPTAGPIGQVASFGITSDPAPFIGIGLISAVISIMLYPRAGLETYFGHKRPLFIAGVIFMPLFIVLAALLRAPFGTPGYPYGLEWKAALAVIILVGFWLSASMLSSRWTQGVYVPGLEVRPLTPFRPDLILPGGVNFVKGTVLTGVGTMLMIHDRLMVPIWNWWGFEFAFWGIILLIPVRGIVKMTLGKRPRMLGERWAFGAQGFWGRETLLYIGLLVLLYGFVNAFKGYVPFTALGSFPRYDGFSNGAAGWLGLFLAILSFIILVPIRGWYKTTLREGTETMGQLFAKQLILYLGTLLLILGFIHLFNLPVDATNPAIHPGVQFAGVYPVDNPLGFTAGLILFILGALLILVFRPIALRNEFRATLQTMVGVVASLPDDFRMEVTRRRLNTLASMPDEQRDAHFKEMVLGLNQLSEEMKARMLKTNLEILSQLTEDRRMRCMRSMDKAMEAVPANRT